MKGYYFGIASLSSLGRLSLMLSVSATMHRATAYIQLDVSFERYYKRKFSLRHCAAQINVRVIWWTKLFCTTQLYVTKQMMGRTKSRITYFFQTHVRGGLPG